MKKLLLSFLLICPFNLPSMEKALSRQALTLIADIKNGESAQEKKIASDFLIKCESEEEFFRKIARLRDTRSTKHSQEIATIMLEHAKALQAGNMARIKDSVEKIMSKRNEIGWWKSTFIYREHLPSSEQASFDTLFCDSSASKECIENIVYSLLTRENRALTFFEVKGIIEQLEVVYPWLNEKLKQKIGVLADCTIKQQEPLAGLLASNVYSASEEIAGGFQLAYHGRYNLPIIKFIIEQFPSACTSRHLLQTVKLIDREKRGFIDHSGKKIKNAQIIRSLVELRDMIFNAAHTPDDILHGYLEVKDDHVFESTYAHDPIPLTQLRWFLRKGWIKHDAISYSFWNGNESLLDKLVRLRRHDSNSSKLAALLLNKNVRCLQNHWDDLTSDVERLGKCGKLFDGLVTAAQRLAAQETPEYKNALALFDTIYPLEQEVEIIVD
jgi:hypothetical protein